MSAFLTIILWIGYLVLMFALGLPGVNIGFLPVLGIAVVWTIIIEGLRALLVRKPENRS